MSPGADGPWRSSPVQRIRNNLDLPLSYATSAYGGLRDHAQFQSVKAYCLFVGYPRSGHSLFGSLIDAHPEAVIAHELDALRYLQAGFTRSQVYSLILGNARRHGDRREHVYDYTVAGQWQGRHRQIAVIGDKKGGRSTRRLAQQPGLLDRLNRAVGVPVRFVHVVRNPFDNIATILARTMPEQGLGAAIAEYLRLCHTVDQLRRRAPAAFLDVRLESLVADPHAVVGRVCAFLGLDASAGYLDACAAIVFPSPRRTRLDAPWTPELRAEVERAVDDHDFLHGYTFSD